MKLVIVESPTKARTIGKFLGDGYEIQASMGHVVDLPKSKLGVDVDHNFDPRYELVKDKKEIVAQLQKAVQKADSVILATDPDREGEAIAAHVVELLTKNAKETSRNSRKNLSLLRVDRIVFHEITKEAIEGALKNPRSINKSLVDAQTARRVLDRLVGYKLSPLLWQKVRRGLSAGRVQSVALRLIVEREREIEKFKKEAYWTIEAFLTRGPAAGRVTPRNGSVEFELVEIKGEKIETQEVHNLYDGEYKVKKTIFDTEEKAKKVEDDLKTKQFIVADVVQKETKRTPSPPYTTSTLQQDAAHRLGLNGKRTMRAAQQLYEEGLITYHRTDSVTVSSQAISAIRKFIQDNYGKNYAPEQPRFYTAKQKLAQEAHEAIRPTYVDELQNQKSKVKNQIGQDAERLYELVWRRAVASQMSDAKIESTSVVVDTNDKKYRFKANGSVLVFEGFLKANPQALEDKRLPDFKVNENLRLDDARANRHETQPPPRYNDASIIKTLEEKGIGRPSTYATIIGTIQDRRYVERLDNRFVPTSVGVAVNDFLVRYFSTIDDVPFTAQMEDELDEVAHGKKDWVPMIRAFYAPFEKKLEEVKEEAGRVKIEVEETNEVCPECGSKLVIRIGRFGKFLSCGSFPKCKFSKPFVEETGINCPKCLSAGRQEGKVIVRKTRRGRKFFGCSNYPACDFAAWKLEDIKGGTPVVAKSETTKQPH